MDSLEDSWRPDVLAIVRGCATNVYKIDWEEVVRGIDDATFSLKQFAEQFGRGIRIYLEIHHIGCVDAPVFTASVYSDMCDAVRAGLVNDPANLPSVLFHIVTSRADLVIEHTFWSIAAKMEAA